MQRPRTRNRLSLRRAFTLVELLIVIIIIAVLAAIAIPKFANSTARSKDASLKSNLKIVRSAVESFRADTGLSPVALVDMTGTAAPSNGINGAGVSVTLTSTSYRGPYIQSEPKDSVTDTALGYSTTGGTPVVKPTRRRSA